jgi:hypothetical protein
VVIPFALYKQRPSCFSVLSIHVPTLSNINVEYLHSIHIRLHHNFIIQTVAQSKCLDSATSTTPTPSFRPPSHQTSPTERVARKKRMGRCIAKALPNQMIFTSSLLVVLSFLVMCCFHSSTHTPLTSKRTTDEKSMYEWASNIFDITPYGFMIFLFTYYFCGFAI